MLFLLLRAELLPAGLAIVMICRSTQYTESRWAIGGQDDDRRLLTVVADDGHCWYNSCRCSAGKRQMRVDQDRQSSLGAFAPGLHRPATATGDRGRSNAVDRPTVDA